MTLRCRLCVLRPVWHDEIRWCRLINLHALTMISNSSIIFDCLLLLILLFLHKSNEKLFLFYLDCWHWSNYNHSVIWYNFLICDQLREVIIYFLLFLIVISIMIFYQFFDVYIVSFFFNSFFVLFLFLLFFSIFLLIGMLKSVLFINHIYIFLIVSDFIFISTKLNCILLFLQLLKLLFFDCLWMNVRCNRLFLAIRNRQSRNCFCIFIYIVVIVNFENLILRITDFSCVLCCISSVGIIYVFILIK